MKFAGIICEYNPIHLGHVYQIEATRRILGEDCPIICAMSGNFVQRGDVSVFSKFSRAEASVRSGADLVIELPEYVSLASAEGFARGGVEILNALGVCSHISFGSEAGDIGLLRRTADILLSREFENNLASELEKGDSFAAARERAVGKISPECTAALSRPNNILAAEYLKALITTGSGMEPVTVLRTGGEHDGEKGLSASALRRGFFSGAPRWELMPEPAVEVFKKEIASGRGPVSINSYNQAIMYRLRTMSREEYERLPGASEGLGLRLMKCAASQADVQKILEKTKTKRYAMSRIRRMVMCAFLGINAEDMGQKPEYIRVLAAGKRGQECLREIKKRGALPLLIKPAAGLKGDFPGKSGFARQCRMTDLYALGFSGGSPGMELRTSPYMEK